MRTMGIPEEAIQLNTGLGNSLPGPAKGCAGRQTLPYVQKRKYSSRKGPDMQLDGEGRRAIHMRPKFWTS